MARIDKLQDELGKCKNENESLIFDLRECKTKMAFLEEKKAMLQIELTRERKKKSKQMKDAEDDKSMNGADEEKNINVTVHSQSNYLGCFPFGGKSNMSVRVQPALSQNLYKKNNTGDKAKELLTTLPERRSESGEISDRLLNNNLNQSAQLYRSPQSRKLVPLSKKFSAYPISDFKSTTNNETR